MISALRDTQRKLYALSMHEDAVGKFVTDDGFNIVKLPVQDFAGTGALRYIVSTYDSRDQMIRDSERRTWAAVW